MCFDPRRSEADRLVDAWQGRTRARDREQDRINEAGAEWALSPPREGAGCPQCGETESRHWGWSLRPGYGEVVTCARCKRQRVLAWKPPSPPRDGPREWPRCPECGSTEIAWEVGTARRCKACLTCWAEPIPSPPREARRVPLVLCPDAPGDPPRGGPSVLSRYGTASDQFAGSIGAWLAERRRAKERDAQFWDDLMAEARGQYRAREARLESWRRRVHAASWWACVLALWAIVLGLLWATLPPSILGGPPLPLPSLAPGPPQSPGGLGR